MATAHRAFIEPQSGIPSSRSRNGVHALSSQDLSEPKFITQWTDLVERASEPNPFFEPALLQSAVSHFDHGSSIEVFAYFQDGALGGLLPLVSGTSYYGYPIPHRATWRHANAFCGVPLVVQGQEHAFWRSILSAMDESPGPSLFLHLPDMSKHGPVSDALTELLEEQGRPSAVVQSLDRAMLNSKLSSEDYLTHSLTQKRRKELRRLKKRLSEQGELSLERVEGQENATRWIDDFLALEQASWKGQNGSALASSSDTNEFFREAMLKSAAAGRLERLAYRLDGQPIAMNRPLSTTPGVFSFKTTFDETYAKFSPGFLLQLENLTLLDRPDIMWADSCAAEGHSMIERIWREKRTIQSINVAIGGPIRRAMFKQLLRRETRQRPSP